MTVRRLFLPLTLLATVAVSTGTLAQGAFPAPLPNQSGAAANNASSPFPPVNSSGAAPARSAANSPFPPVNGAAAPPPSGAGASSPFPPVGGAPAASSPFPAQGAAPFGGMGIGGGSAPAASAKQEECMKAFTPLREETERRAAQIKAASDRKAPPQEACKLISNFVQAEARLVAYVVKNQASCGIPAEIPKQMKSNQSRSAQLQKNVCTEANAPQGGPAAAPSLSEALGSSQAPETRAVRRSGGSTFDTLNGNVLER